MKEIKEFFTVDDKAYVMYQDSMIEEVTEKSKELIEEILDRVQNFYPEAHAALKEWYRKNSLNVPYTRSLMAQRFIKCNFGELDTTEDDVKRDGTFCFEKVSCPMRGECRYDGVVCRPMFNSRLSKAELRVMELYYRNTKIEKIADKLYLSGHTVRNHIRAAFSKLGVHSQAEFITYANRNHLFD